MSGSALYRGQVMHARYTPVHNMFRYAVYMWLVDLDDPPRLSRLMRPLGQLRSADHLGDPGLPIKRNLLAYLDRHGIDLQGGRVLLLTNARVLGYVFNPLSVFYCHDPGGELRCLVAEVHNTHGERHCYLLHPGDRGRCETDKEFYVSPFLTVDGRYRMSFAPPGERLNVQMELIQDDVRVFQASLTGRRVPLTNRSLLRAAARHPLMTLRVTGLIHLQGVRLFLRRVPRVRRPPHNPQQGVG